MLLFIRSLIFFIGMVLSTVIVGTLVLLSFPFHLTHRYRVSQLWSRFNTWWVKQTCGIDYHVSGLEYLPKGSAILMAKHQSTWETMFFHQFLPPMAIVLKRELLWVPFFGWALALLHPISIDRSAAASAVKQMMRQGRQHLSKGEWVLIFPEGTRTAPGSRQPYGIGGAMLAAHSGYPIVPVAHNAGEFWPRRGFIKRPGTIRLVFGPPIDSRGYTARELNILTEDWIETTMEKISTVSTRKNDTAS